MKHRTWEPRFLTWMQPNLVQECLRRKELTLECAQQTPSCSWLEEEEEVVGVSLWPAELHPCASSCCTYGIPPDAWTLTGLSLPVGKSVTSVHIWVLCTTPRSWASCELTFLFSCRASLAWVALIAWYAFLFFRRFSGTNLIIFLVLKQRERERDSQYTVNSRPMCGEKLLILTSRTV